MIVYNVTINIDADAHVEWVNWMNNQHIPDVLATGLFLDARICRLINVEEEGGLTYSIQYTAETMDDMKAYEEKHAPRLRADFQARYDGKFAAFRTMMEVVGMHKP